MIDNSRSVIDAAQRLHAHAQATEHITEPELTTLREWLYGRLEMWTVSFPYARDYDDAVRAMCVAALRETQPESTSYVCTLCNADAKWSEDGCFRHANQDSLQDPSTFCDRYGYPIHVAPKGMNQ